MSKKFFVKILLKKKNRRCYRFEQNFETVRWNKEIKRTAKKTKFQTSTCAKQETPKIKCKTYAKPKIPKQIMKKVRNHGQGQAPPWDMARARPCLGPPGPALALGSA
jgi:hypothetical protein